MMVNYFDVIIGNDGLSLAKGTLEIGYTWWNQIVYDVVNAVMVKRWISSGEWIGGQ